MSLVEDAAGNRFKETNTFNGETALLLGHYEQRTQGGITTHIHHIAAGGQTIAIVESKSNGTQTTQYLHRDHLGSITAITNEAGQLIERLSYDAWGKRREANWQDATTQLTSSQTPRGYTGHEHLDDTSLIHMNGRVYDPAKARFAAADPFVQAAGYSQSFNRYSYVLNGPLTRWDPSGYADQEIEEITITGTRWPEPPPLVISFTIYRECLGWGLCGEDMSFYFRGLPPSPPAQPEMPPPPTPTPAAAPSTANGGMGAGKTPGAVAGTTATIAGSRIVLSPELSRLLAQLRGLGSRILGGVITTGGAAAEGTLTVVLVVFTPGNLEFGREGCHSSVRYCVVDGVTVYSPGYYNEAADKKLTPGEIKKLKDYEIDPEELKGGKSTGKLDLFKDQKGDIIIKPKDGSGPGEPTGININDL